MKTHETHYDDCGCLTARFAAALAEKDAEILCRNDAILGLVEALIDGWEDCEDQILRDCGLRIVNGKVEDIR